MPVAPMPKQMEQFVHWHHARRIRPTVLNTSPLHHDGPCLIEHPAAMAQQHCSPRHLKGCPFATHSHRTLPSEAAGVGSLWCHVWVAAVLSKVGAKASLSQKCTPPSLCGTRCVVMMPPLDMAWCWIAGCTLGLPDSSINLEYNTADNRDVIEVFSLALAWIEPPIPSSNLRTSSWWSNPGNNTPVLRSNTRGYVGRQTQLG